MIGEKVKMDAEKERRGDTGILINFLTLRVPVSRCPRVSLILNVEYALK